jgi:hypothetical protein
MPPVTFLRKKLNFRSICEEWFYSGHAGDKLHVFSIGLRRADRPVALVRGSPIRILARRRRCLMSRTLWLSGAKRM